MGSKHRGMRSFDVTATSTPAPLVAANGGDSRFTQNMTLLADSANSAVVYLGGPDAQTFPLAAGASIALGDIYHSHREWFDMFYVYVKAASGSQTIHVACDKEYPTP